MSKRNEKKQPEFDLVKYVLGRIKQYNMEHEEYIQDSNIIEQARFMSNILLEKSAFDEKLILPNIEQERQLRTLNLLQNSNYDSKIEKMKVTCSSYADALVWGLNVLGRQSVVSETTRGHKSVLIPLYDQKLLDNPETKQFFGKVLEIDHVSEKDIFYAIKKFYNQGNINIYDSINKNDQIVIDYSKGPIYMPSLHEYIKKVDEKQGYLKGMGYTEEAVDMLAEEMADEKKFLSALETMPQILKKIIVKQDVPFITSILLQSENINELKRSSREKLKKICNPRKTRQILKLNEQQELETILNENPNLLNDFLKVEDDPGRIARYKLGFLSETLSTEKLGIYEYKGYIKAILDKVITKEERKNMDLLMIANGVRRSIVSIILL